MKENKKSKSIAKIKINQLDDLVKAKERIDYLERTIEGLDNHLQELTNEDYEMNEHTALEVYCKFIGEDGERNKYPEKLKIHPSEFPYEKIISKQIKKLRKELEQLKSLFDYE